MKFEWQEDINGKYNIIKKPGKDDIGFIDMIDKIIEEKLNVMIQRGKWTVYIIIEPVNKEEKKLL